MWGGGGSTTQRVGAAGDVTGHPEFVYVAAHHGTLVAENAFADADRSVDYARLPRVTSSSACAKVTSLP